MNKNLFIVLFFLFGSVMSFAQTVTKSQALACANALLQGKKLTEVNIKNQTVTTRFSDMVPFYVFNAEEGGFAVISGDDRLPAVLAFSHNGHFDNADLPDNVAAWFAGITRQIEALREGKGKLRTMNRAPSSHEPLMDFAWCQHEPFKLCCNVKPDGMEEQQCFPGCVATAMAQLIYYYAKKSDAAKVQCTALPSYTYKFNGKVNTTVPALEATTFDWENMRGYYKKTDTEGASPQAVAKLMYYCAVAIETMFGTEVSLAYENKVIKAMTTYFGYPDHIEFVRSKDYAWEDFENLLRTEIEAGRPVLYGAENTLGGDGHDMIVDGWDAEGRFHINWGWDRYGEGKGKEHYNGYFMLTEMVVPYVENQAFNGSPVAFLNFAPSSVSSIKGLQTVDVDNSSIYNLQGSKLNTLPTRGFYIKGGKKFVR